MPVEAAEEDRVQRARRQGILITRQRMIELVGIFARDMAQRDPRHVALVVVHEGPLAARRYTGFAMGLAECEGPDPISALQALRGEAALAHFLALRGSFDISS